MDSMSKHRATRKLLAGRLSALAGALAWCAVVVGCAAVAPPTTQSVSEHAPAVQDKTITRLEAGRAGFVITEKPGSPTPWRADFERAVVLMREDKEQEAIPVLEGIVRQSPGVTAPYINLAMAYRHAGQFEQAETMIQTALELIPDHPVANNEYGLLLRQTGRFAEAREVYQTTLRMFPEYLPVRRNLGILCELYLDDTACALEQYTIYNEVNPGDQAVALWIADLNLRTGGN